MKITCTKAKDVPFTIGKAYNASEAQDGALVVNDDQGKEWWIEPHLGHYAIMAGGMNFISLRTVAKFEQETTQSHFVVK